MKAQRAARMGRNPATGEALKIAAKTTVNSGWLNPPRMLSFRPSASGTLKLFSMNYLRLIMHLMFISSAEDQRSVSLFTSRRVLAKKGEEVRTLCTCCAVWKENF